MTVEFRPEVVLIDPAEADGVIAAAAAAGVPVRVLRTGDRAGRDAFFDEVRAVLPLDPPVETARSWDALEDSLWEGIRVSDEPRLVILWPDAPAYRASSPADYDLAFSTLRDLPATLADERITGGRPKSVAVYVAV